MADCFADAVSPCPPWRHAWSVHFLFGLALSAFAGFILSAVSRMRQRLRHFIRHLSNHPLSVWTSTMGQPFLRSGQYVHVQPHSHTQPRGGLFAVGTASKWKERAIFGFRVYAEVAMTYSQPVKYGVAKSPQQCYGESYTLIFPDAKLWSWRSFGSYGTDIAFDQRLSTNLPFSFHRLNKKSICRTFRWCYPMPMSSFCIVKIKCLTL